MLGPEGWWIPGAGEPVDLGAATAVELLETAARLDARQVWIIDAGAGKLCFDWTRVPGWSTTPFEDTRSDRPPIWVWAHRPPRHAVSVSYVDPDPRRHPWAGAGPAELLAQLEAFRAALGVDWNATGGLTSDRWLRQHYRSAGGLRLAASEAVTVPIAPNGPAEMRRWARPPTRAELAGGGLWVHGYDVNGMFLAAASSLPLPVGPAHHRTNPAPDPGRPGWWRLEGEEVWIPSPTLELETQRRPIGRDDIAEAWIWGESHRWLEPWYRAIRSARSRLEPGTIAARALKDVYTRGVGRLGSAKRAQSTADPLYQPYWRYAVQAEANARLSRKLHRIRDHHGQVPIAQNVDCTWWISTEPDPAAFADRTGIPVDTQLGHFKHAGTQPLTPELLEALYLPAAGAIDRLTNGGR